MMILVPAVAVGIITPSLTAAVTVLTTLIGLVIDVAVP
jgi:hypothetical protein